MKLSDHFTVEQFAGSDTALRLEIDNQVPATLLPEAQRTCEMLERIRARLSRLCGRSVPIIITSGYRCPALNRAIGSADTSDHVRGMAVDFKAGLFGSAYQVARILAAEVAELQIGQLIHEYGSWVHVSTRQPDKQLNRVITISRRGAEVGIVEVA